VFWFDPISAALCCLGGLSLAGLVITFLADRAVRRGLRRPVPTASGPPPPISILKPVKGLDDGLERNLLSLADQAYPSFEILVGAAEPGDPGLAVARRVAARRPGARIRTFVCPADGGLNPKVSILRALERFARHELLLISDSNVRADATYLADTAAELSDPAVGLVTNPIVGTGERSPGALLEGLHLVTFVARATTFAAAHLDRACVVGKSMLFRRSDLARLGGWDPVRDVLAEDYMIGNAFQRAGFRVACSPHVLATYNRDWSVSRFINRHLRWGQMRRRVHLLGYLLEPVLSPSALMTVMALLSLFTGAAMDLVLPLAVGGIVIRLIADRALWRQMRGTPPAWSTLALSLPKDLLVLLLWAVGGFRRTICWRGNLFMIGPGTRLEPKSPRPTPVAIEEAV
jgi:ceramide glucosyltransferase